MVEMSNRPRRGMAKSGVNTGIVGSAVTSASSSASAASAPPPTPPVSTGAAPTKPFGAGNARLGPDSTSAAGIASAPSALPAPIAHRPSTLPNAKTGTFAFVQLLFFK